MPTVVGDHVALVRYPGPEPFTEQAQYPAIGDPVLDELQQPLVIDGVEETTNVRVEHPVYLPLGQTYPQRIQCVVRVAARPKPVAEAEEVLLVDVFEHGLDGLLDDLVFQGRNAQGTLSPVGFGNPCPLGGLCPVGPAVNPVMKVEKPTPQTVRPVLFPGHPVHPRSTLPASAGRSLSQSSCGVTW